MLRKIRQVRQELLHAWFPLHVFSSALLIYILDVKCDPDLVGMLIQTYGFLPGYHMNKRHWITILLDESVSEAKTLDFLDMSYDLIDSGK